MYNRNRTGRRPRFPSRNMSRFRRPTKKSNVPDISMYIKKAKPVQDEAEEIEQLIRFQDIPFHPSIQEALKRRGFTDATPIQSKTMPHILASKDVIGLANTGTGKTGAFVLPLIQKMLARPEERVLILVPTRELGQQIRNEIFEFSHNMRLFSTLCIGGMNIDFQIQRLRRDPHFIIGTPGRLKDLIERGVLKLDKVKNVVLDEADRMVDMGFIQDITHILSKLPTERQSLFFSATMDKQIEPIVNRFLRDPITVSVVKQKTSENIDQDIIRVPLGKDKIDILHELLEKNEVQKALIFGKTKRGVDSLSWKLNKRGLKTAAIHGDKPQRKRDQALRMFKQDAIDFLVATDVAARGIDIPDISHVINFDQPSTYDDYVHRIGRTGRGDKKGTALTFV